MFVPLTNVEQPPKRLSDVSFKRQMPRPPAPTCTDTHKTDFARGLSARLAGRPNVALGRHRPLGGLPWHTPDCKMVAGDRSRHLWSPLELPNESMAGGAWRRPAPRHSRNRIQQAAASIGLPVSDRTPATGCRDLPQRRRYVWNFGRPEWPIEPLVRRATRAPQDRRVRHPTTPPCPHGSARLFRQQISNSASGTTAGRHHESVDWLHSELDNDQTSFSDPYELGSSIIGQSRCWPTRW